MLALGVGCNHHDYSREFFSRWSTDCSAELHVRGGPSASPPHRPFKVVYSSLYANVTPSFVVDISPYFDRRMESLFAYESQYGEQPSAAGLFPNKAEITDRLRSIARFYGNLIGVKYGEPFVVKEAIRIDDLFQMPVRSI